MLRHFAVSVFLSLALTGYAQTKVGGSGTSKIGGSGTSKVSSAGPNAWFDIATTSSAGFGANSAAVNWQNEGIALTAGTTTKCRFWIQTYYGGGTVGIKAALCNSGGTVVASGTGTSGTASGAYAVITWDSPVTVSTATYKLLVSAANSNIDFGYSATTGVINRNGSAGGYASMPMSIPGVESTDATRQMKAGVFVQ